MTARVVVLASGNGSNFQALLDAVELGTLDAEITGLVCNKPSAYAIERAAWANVPTTVLTVEPAEARPDYDTRLAAAVAAFAPDVVVLAGWMRLLSMPFLSRFSNRVINLHPALPGAFPGTHAIERALEAAQRGEIRQTGVMVHYVPDEGVDDGPVIATATVPIQPDDTVETLSERVHSYERGLLVSALRQVITDLASRGAT